MTSIDRQALEQLIDSGEVVLLEALPAEYFNEGHLPGAANLPLDEIDTSIETLAPDKDATIVTYCTGTSCSNSLQAAERLRELGYRDVRAYEAGKEDWIEAGLPTEGAHTPA